MPRLGGIVGPLDGAFLICELAMDVFTAFPSSFGN